jgi:uncharacterized membrane protein YeiB
VRNGSFRYKLFLTAAGLAIIAASISKFYLSLFDGKNIVVDPDRLKMYLSTDPMPPMPLFMLSAGGTALASILVCVWFGDKFGSKVWLKPIIYAGQMPYTLYVLFVIVGMGLGKGVFRLDPMSVQDAFIYAIGYFMASVLLAFLWRLKFKYGPVEWLLRLVNKPS